MAPPNQGGATHHLAWARQNAERKRELSMSDAESRTISPKAPARASAEACVYWLQSLADGVRFMTAASQHPLAESLQPLVSIEQAAANTGAPILCLDSPHPVGRERDHRIRRGNLEPLLAVARDLHAQGFMLVIEDALRSPQTQRHAAASRLLARRVGEMLACADPNAGDQAIVERLGAICAATPITAGHVAGAAVDVSVRAADGSELDRGAGYLDLSERMPMSSPFVEAEQARARELITAAMARQGFIAYPFEFWHYSRGDVLAALASGSSDPAIYGPVHASADGSVTPVEDLQAPLGDPAALVSAVRAAIREVQASSDREPGNG
jgi:D-alanyl-D-alanine dipeptidase